MMVLADEAKAGIVGTLPPWALILVGLGLLLVAALLHRFCEKSKEEPFLLEMASFVCGIGGLYALLRGIFGLS